MSFDSTILVALLSLAGTLIGSMAGILAANKLVVYRVEELEKKVDKHNNLIERVALIEQNDKAQWRNIDEIKARIKELHHGG